jgi:hypothetical protein
MFGLKIFILLLLPVIAYFISRRLIPGHIGCFTGVILGIVIFPISYILTHVYSLYPSFYNFVSFPVHLFTSLAEGISYSHELITNGVVWGGLCGFCGFILDRIIKHESEYNQFASVEEKLKGIGLQSVSVFSEKGPSIYERAKSILDDEDEAIAEELVIASNQKDRDKTKKIGNQLNDSGGIDRMKLLCYRARNLGGDDRWIEMTWSGIGEWMG